LEVPPVRPLSAAIAEVEAVSVTLAQHKGDVSSAGMPEPREVMAESWMPRPREARVELLALRGAQPKVWAPCGAQWRLMKHTTKKPRRVGWSDHPGQGSIGEQQAHGRTAQGGGWPASVVAEREHWQNENLSSDYHVGERCAAKY
jgi:hypothetical protein